MQQKPAEQVWLKFQSMVASADREAGIGLKPDGWSGGIHLVEWRSTRAPSEPCVTAKHHCWVVEALSFYRPQRGEIPHISLPRWVLIWVSRFVVWGILDPSQGHSHYTPMPQSWHSTWHICHGWQCLHIGSSKVSKKFTFLLLYIGFMFNLNHIVK